MTARRLARTPAIGANKIKAGMRILWKPGDADDVIGVEELGPVYLMLTLRDSVGKQRERRIRKTSIVEGFWPSS